MIDTVAQSLRQLRESAPLVQLITNYVSMNIAANALIAVGASPAMVQAPEEASEFLRDCAQALAVNIGTLSDISAQTMAETAKTANAADKPWVLDPVAVGATQFRRDTGAKLLSLRPTIIRGNASEIRALANRGGSSRGVDAGDMVSEAESDARNLAHSSGAVVAITGPMDFITDGDRAMRLFGGHGLMPKVTALGCALSGVTAAFATTAAPYEATLAALAAYAAAGSLAGEHAAGPGSFAVAFIDALHMLTPDMVHERTRIEIL